MTETIRTALNHYPETFGKVLVKAISYACKNILGTLDLQSETMGSHNSTVTRSIGSSGFYTMFRIYASISDASIMVQLTKKIIYFYRWVCSKKHIQMGKNCRMKIYS